MFQLWIRSAVDDYAGGLALARAALDALLDATIDGYMACRVQQSEPLYLQADGTNRHEFMVVAQLRWAR